MPCTGIRPNRRKDDNENEIVRSFLSTEAGGTDTRKRYHYLRNILAVITDVKKQEEDLPNETKVQPNPPVRESRPILKSVRPKEIKRVKISKETGDKSWACKPVQTKKADIHPTCMKYAGYSKEVVMSKRKQEEFDFVTQGYTKQLASLAFGLTDMLLHGDVPEVFPRLLGNMCELAWHWQWRCCDDHPIQAKYRVETEDGDTLFRLYGSYLYFYLFSLDDYECTKAWDV